jgi:ATP-dependent RNA helicase DDX49/DBP8
MAKFSALGLDSWVENQCLKVGIESPTPIQTECIPEILAGKDCIGCAKTGSGKTLAFALPMLQTLSEDPYGIFALVLTPTRELAFQVGCIHIFFFFDNNNSPFFCCLKMLKKITFRLQINFK